jgi:hypothetical protein
MYEYKYTKLSSRNGDRMMAGVSEIQSGLRIDFDGIDYSPANRPQIFDSPPV